MDVWYTTTKSIVGAYIALFVRKIHIEGRDNIPPGAKIVVANHALASDGFLLPFIFPDKLHYMIQEDIFRIPFVGKLLAMADQIPVVKGQGIEALQNALDKLAEGKTIALFPEGRLNDGKKLLKAFTGAARLALESGAPVVPVGFYTPPKYARPIASSLFGRPTSGTWQFGGPSFISIGNSWKPFIEKPLSDTYQYARVVRDLTDDLMGRINNLVERANAFAATWFPSLKSEPVDPGSVNEST